MTGLSVICFRNTSERLVGKDGNPVLVESDFVDEYLDSAERRVNADLVAFGLDEYHERFVRPVAEAKHRATSFKQVEKLEDFAAFMGASDPKDAVAKFLAAQHAKAAAQ